MSIKVAFSQYKIYFTIYKHSSIKYVGSGSCYLFKQFQFIFHSNFSLLIVVYGFSNLMSGLNAPQLLFSTGAKQTLHNNTEAFK